MDHEMTATGLRNTLTLRCGFAVILGSAAILSLHAQPETPHPATPTNAVEGILGAFSSHSIVALDEGMHNNIPAHQFRLALIRDSRFADTINDIVVEFGNALYQDRMDRFIAGGEVPDAELREVWQNTTQANAVWDVPIYEDFFRAVRDLNVTLPASRRVRILLGDPPVDWSTVRAGNDVGRWTVQRDAHAVMVIEREVIAKNRSALVIYGGGHLFRAGRRLVALLEAAIHRRVFTIVTPIMPSANVSLLKARTDLARWPIPSLALIRGTTLDAQQFVYYDAVLYVGTQASFSTLPKALCLDKSYLEMRTSRLRVVGMDREAERLLRRCAN